MVAARCVSAADCVGAGRTLAQPVRAYVLRASGALAPKTRSKSGFLKLINEVYSIFKTIKNRIKKKAIPMRITSVKLMLMPSPWAMLAN